MTLKTTGNARTLERACFWVSNQDQERFLTCVKGRQRWALECLLDGPCTPINRPAPRWSAYIKNLRDSGLQIRTEWQCHDGDFPGRHGVYHLLSKVEPLVEDFVEAA